MPSTVGMVFPRLRGHQPQPVRRPRRCPTSFRSTSSSKKTAPGPSRRPMPTWPSPSGGAFSDAFAAWLISFRAPQAGNPAGLDRLRIWPHGRMRSRSSNSDSDRDLAADLAVLEVPHGVRDLIERVAAVQAGGDLAGLDEVGEPLEVAGALLGYEQGEALPQEW
jgi:hypothetical protein